MIDEMEYKRRKDNHKKGIETNWFIDSIDTETRFMLSSTFAEKRDNKAIREVVKGMRFKTENQIKSITTDGFNVYDEIVKRYYGYNRYNRDYQIEHHKVIASKGEGFNHKIERLHNSIRERTKIFRGFHGSINSAKAIMQGYTIFYNFIRKHQAINCCPYELAIPNLKLNENKWLDLIYATKKEKI